MSDIDELAQEIRRVDGNHSLGAGALAEALMPFIRRARSAYADGEGERVAPWNDPRVCWVCEQHPTEVFPHDDCAGPGMMATDAIAAMKKRKDGAYEERNKVVAALAKLFPSGKARTNIEGWSEDWHGCVYIDLPTGQVSWHYHDSQAWLFDDLPPYQGQWDGHDTPEKYKRLAALGFFWFGAPALARPSPMGENGDTGESEPVCDCQCPEPASDTGAALISESCPFHNDLHYAAKYKE